MSRIEDKLFAVTAFAGLAGFVDCITSNILNKKLRDPFVRAPINFVLDILV